MTNQATTDVAKMTYAVIHYNTEYGDIEEILGVTDDFSKATRLCLSMCIEHVRAEKKAVYDLLVGDEIDQLRREELLQQSLDDGDILTKMLRAQKLGVDVVGAYNAYAAHMQVKTCRCVAAEVREVKILP